MRIRPSLLQRAERCGLVPVLAEKFPEAGDAADRGTRIHAEISKALMSGEDPRSVSSPEAKAAFRWLIENAEGKLQVEHQVCLFDTDMLDDITEGTPDAVWGPDASGVTTVVDWKTGSAENIADANDNLQLIAYGLAVCDGGPFRCVLVFLDGDKAAPRWSRVFEPSEHAELLARVKAAANREPVAHPGEHCGSCWQRRYCTAWKARESQAIALIDETRMLAVTDDNAGLIMSRAKAVREAADAADAIVKAHVRSGGRCVVDGKDLVITTCKGRESTDVKQLKADGLDKYIKRGSPYERASWRKKEAS
jgi:hypothetical protein